MRPGAILQWARRAIVGPPRNPFDPAVRERIALAAFLAWIGLGADGLSSANYGPELGLPRARRERASRVLSGAADRGHRLHHRPRLQPGHPALSDGRRRVSRHDEAFSESTPASSPASVSIVDYVLTIAISIASGIDALFSLLPPPWTVYKVRRPVCRAICLLVVLNLRGMQGKHLRPDADLPRLPRDACRC